jgi:hypothetical protein
VGDIEYAEHEHGGEVWTGDGIETGLTLNNYGVGLKVEVQDTAIVAYSPAGPAIVAVSGATVQDQSRMNFRLPRILTNGGNPIYGQGTASDVDVFGESSTGMGVFGLSSEGSGVTGSSSSGHGVHGQSIHGTGGIFNSDEGYGLVASSIHGKAAKFEGDVEVDGEVYAKSLHTSNDGGATTTCGVTTDGKATFSEVAVPHPGGGTFSINPTAIDAKDHTGQTQASIYPSGTITTKGNLSVQGTKNAIVSTSDYGQRKLYCDESAEVYFFDRGQGQLINGEVTLELDPLFLETVTIDDDHPMLVQITLTANCRGVYVSEQTEASFTVRELMDGTSNATFNWEVAAKRKGYENDRLELFTSER